MEREMLGNLFRYEDDKLYRKRKNGSQWSCCNELKPDANQGYIHVRMGGKNMLLHRLVYLFHNPAWDISDSSHDNCIDHINMNKRNNRIENLRVVTNSQNHQNITHIRGKPIRGVYFHKQSNNWGAHWYENGKQKIKFFKTEPEALEHRAKMVELHYSHAPRKEPNNNDN